MNLFQTSAICSIMVRLPLHQFSRPWPLVVVCYGEANFKSGQKSKVNASNI